jgi:hypothetical protein
MARSRCSMAILLRYGTNLRYHNERLCHGSSLSVPARAPVRQLCQRWRGVGARGRLARRRRARAAEARPKPRGDAARGRRPGRPCVLVPAGAAARAQRTAL